MAITYKSPVISEVTISCDLTTGDIATLMTALIVATEHAKFDFEKSEFKALSRDLSIALTLGVQDAEGTFRNAKSKATRQEEKLSKVS